ncbi:MAG: carboxypeptidase-like regulatory domain-containing protein [Saprospiraceae bacterium]|nr:carboxypeptidase-like regulatory domain-containing protein [Saprospiraceae bacterium]
MYSFTLAIRLLNDMPVLSKNRRIIVVFLVFIGYLCPGANAQQSSVLQFSGIVYQSEDDKKTPLPYVNVGILRNRRATYSNEQGFFSIAAQTGDTILFQYLGYKNKKFILPNVVLDPSYFSAIILERDTIQLSKTTVYPIPSKEHFKQEFLAMNVHDEMRSIAEKNLEADVLAWLEPGVPSDGRAGVSLYFRQEANNAVYDGQFKPLQIFNPLAWIDFIKALKRGDFKKKKKPPE